MVGKNKSTPAGINPPPAITAKSVKSKVDSAAAAPAHLLHLQPHGDASSTLHASGSNPPPPTLSSSSSAAFHVDGEQKSFDPAASSHDGREFGLENLYYPPPPQTAEQQYYWKYIYSLKSMIERNMAAGARYRPAGMDRNLQPAGSGHSDAPPNLPAAYQHLNRGLHGSAADRAINGKAPISLSPSKGGAKSDPAKRPAAAMRIKPGSAAEATASGSAADATQSSLASSASALLPPARPSPSHDAPAEGGTDEQLPTSTARMIDMVYNYMERADDALYRAAKAYFLQSNSNETADSINPSTVELMRKKIAALEFETGIRLSAAGTLTDVRHVLDSFPGDSNVDDFLIGGDFDELADEDNLDDDNDEDDGEITDHDLSGASCSTAHQQQYQHYDQRRHHAAALLDDGFIMDDPTDSDEKAVVMAFRHRRQPSPSNSSATFAEHSDGEISDKKSTTYSAPSSHFAVADVEALRALAIQEAQNDISAIFKVFEANNLSSEERLESFKQRLSEMSKKGVRHRIEAAEARKKMQTAERERDAAFERAQADLLRSLHFEQWCRELQAQSSHATKEGKASAGTVPQGADKITDNKTTLSTQTSSFAPLPAATITSLPKAGSNATGKKKKKKTTGATTSLPTETAREAATSTKGHHHGASNTTTSADAAADGIDSYDFSNIIGKMNPTYAADTYEFSSKAKSWEFLELPEACALEREDSPRLITRLLTLMEQYNLREKSFLSLLRAKEQDIVAMKKRLVANKLATDKFMIKSELVERQLANVTYNEAELKSQLVVYVEKFKQVEETLVKSNDLFSTFRHEMEQMSVKLNKLERENLQLQNKCTTLSRNIIEMADERTKQNASLDVLRNQKTKLEALCRSLQSERNSAAAKIAEIEKVAAAASAGNGLAASAPPTVDSDK